MCTLFTLLIPAVHAWPNYLSSFRPEEQKGVSQRH